MRGGPAKVGALSRGGEPWRAESPGELRASGGLNSRRGVADSRAEQTPEGGEASAGLFDPVISGLRTAGAYRFGGACSMSARHFGVACPEDSWRFGVAGAKGFRRFGVGVSAGSRCFGIGESVFEAGKRGRRFGGGFGSLTGRRVRTTSVARARRTRGTSVSRARRIRGVSAVRMRRGPGASVLGFRRVLGVSASGIRCSVSGGVRRRARRFGVGFRSGALERACEDGVRCFGIGPWIRMLVGRWRARLGVSAPGHGIRRSGVEGREPAFRRRQTELGTSNGRWTAGQAVSAAGHGERRSALNDGFHRFGVGIWSSA
jgi:hypothetical protein